MDAQPLTPLTRALEQLLVAAPIPTACRRCDVSGAAGAVLGEDVHALIDVPPTDNSAMDGYAVSCRDAGKTIPVTARVAAGQVPAALQSGCAARIFTGAVVPPGADAVVLQEEAVAGPDGVALPPAIEAGQNIRRRGQDCRRGEPILRAGQRLGPMQLGLLASQGIVDVPVFPRLRVAILSTGNELREPDGASRLPPGAIYNSNRPMLAALLAELGAEVADLGIVPDDLPSTRDALQRAAAGADVIVSSGGVSVGEADFVKEAVRELGSLELWKVAIKPGKPFAFGRVADKPFLGLPGNPVSACVTFLLLARPFLMRMQGRRDTAAPRFRAQAAFAYENRGPREEYLRVRLEYRDASVFAALFRNQSSGVLSSLTEADAFAVLAPHSAIAVGEPLDVLPLDLLRR